MTVSAPRRRGRLLVDPSARLALRLRQWPDWDFTVEASSFAEQPDDGELAVTIWVHPEPQVHGDPELRIVVDGVRWANEDQPGRDERNALLDTIVPAIVEFDWDSMADGDRIALMAPDAIHDAVDERHFIRGSRPLVKVAQRSVERRRPTA